MAGHLGEIALSPQSISAATNYWPFQIVAPSNIKIVFKGIFLGNDYNTNGTPGEVRLYRATGAGTGGTSATPASVDEDDTETFQATCMTMIPDADKPTGLTLLRSWYINPQVAIPEYQPLFEEFKTKGGGIIAVEFIPQISGHVAGWLRFEE